MIKRLGKLWIVAADAVLVNLALYLAFMTRFEGVENIPADVAQHYTYLVLVVTIVRIGLFYALRLYRWAWHYAGVDELYSIILAVTVGSAAITTILYLVQISGIPRTVVAIDWAYNVLLIGGFRFASRFLRETTYLMMTPGKDRILIVGAGQTGEMVAYEILRHPELGYHPIGFIDDDPEKQDISIHGIRVLGTRGDMAEIIGKRNINKVLIALPKSAGAGVRDIIARYQKAKVKFEIVPGIQEIIDGKISISQIRQVNVEDLLKRDVIETNVEEISAYLAGRCVLVSGAAGSIGSELCRQICKFGPRRLLMFDYNENNIYYLERELTRKPLPFPTEVVIGDIKDTGRVRSVMDMYKPEVVFHAAAHKHVPLMESSPGESVKNNITGTVNLARAASETGAERFVLISTDKAVNPTSVMGVSKRIAELVVRGYSQNSKTVFVSVRFGNVLASSGSVIPLFKEQIARGGPVTVTHEDVTRYFMTVGEAVELLIQAGAIGKGGEVFVLDVGEPVKIVDLAKDLIALSGLEPGKDIQIVFTGLRPGEKLYEELITAEEGITVSKHKKIFVAKPDIVDMETLTRNIALLEELAENGDEGAIIRKFKEMVPAYQPNGDNALYIGGATK
jgi:FlaA1/EpsC-like NDP-sugar epimerase